MSLSAVILLLLLLLTLSSADAFLSQNRITTTSTRLSCPTSSPPTELSAGIYTNVTDAIIPPLLLTIVIPAYDEANRIVETLETYTSYIESNSDSLPPIVDILVVDDGSNDGTAAVVLDFARSCMSNTIGLIRVVSLSTNLGKGEAVARGIQEVARHSNVASGNMKACFGSLILVADADGSGDISCVREMINSLEGVIKNKQQQQKQKCQQKQLLNELHTMQSFWKHYALIVGDRGYDGAGTARSILRWGFRTAVQLICGNLGVSDTQCGMKLMTLNTASVLYCDLNLKRWTHDVEVLYRAKVRGIPLAEVPVRWKDKEGSKLVTSAGGAVRASAMMLLEILRMRIEYAIGRWHV